MPWPIGFRGAESGAPALPRRSAMTSLQAGAEAEAAVALGEVHPRQAEVELGAEELPRARRGRRVLGQQLLATVEDGLFFAHDELPLQIGRTSECW